MRYRAVYEANLLAQKKLASKGAMCEAMGIKEEVRLLWLACIQEKLDELYPKQKEQPCTDES